jgi:TRAP-type C4-dicarboxylate transport system permease small subunit
MGPNPLYRSAGALLRRLSEGIVAMLLAVIFVSFIAGIVFRYLLNLPVGWPSELSVVCWLWLVLWGAAFVLEERDEIRFDLITGAVSHRARVAMGLVVAVAIVVLYAMSLPAAISYVSFMKVERTAYLKIRLDWLYSIYVLFAVAVIVRYVWILVRLLRGGDPLAVDADHVSSGL